MRLLSLLLFWLCCLAAWAQQDFVLVTSQQTPLAQIELRQLRDLYLGKLARVDGARLRPLNLQDDDATREDFLDFLFEADFDWSEYWLVQKLQGRQSPPIEVRGWGVMLLYLSRNPGFVGYVPREKADQLAAYRLKTITIVDDSD